MKKPKFKVGDWVIITKANGSICPFKVNDIRQISKVSFWDTGKVIVRCDTKRADGYGVAYWWFEPNHVRHINLGKTPSNILPILDI